jgi:hypothetical protein
MLTRLRRHPPLAGAGEMLTDAIRYVTVMLVLVMFLGYIARLAAGSP